MKQENIFGFLGGLIGGFSLFILAASFFFFQFHITSLPVSLFSAYSSEGNPPVHKVALGNVAKPVVLPPHSFIPFPETRLVLRNGEKSLEAPDPKYADKDYLDIDTERKVATLFVQGEAQAMYRILAMGNPWTSPTPKGEFTIRTKEPKHFSRKVGLWMPWAMQIHGDYFLHGWPYYPDGTPYRGKYSRGCVRLATEEIADLFQRITIGTSVVIY